MNNEMKSKRVVISVTVDHAIQYHKDLAQKLVEDGWQVHVVSSGGSALNSLGPGIKTHELKMERNPSPFKDILSLFRWVQLLSRIKPSVVVAGTPKASMLGIMAARMTRVPVRIYWVHGLRLETANGFLRLILLKIEQLTAKNATKLLAVSKSLKDRVESLYITDSDKIVVLGKGSTQGVELDRFSKKFTSPEKATRFEELGLQLDIPVIGFVGRLTEDKGIAELRNAVISLSQRGVDLQLLLVGPVEDGLGEEVIQQIKNAGINLVATGRVDDTSKYFGLMNIFCLPSYREGLPNVVLEAFAAGIPVVSTYITGVIDLIENGKTGFLVQPKNSEELAQAIEKIILEPEFARNISDSAFKLVQQHFDADLVIDTQKEFINQEFLKST